MRILTSAIIILTLGLIAGLVHSYYRPLSLRPQNNPVTTPATAAAPAVPPTDPGASESNTTEPGAADPVSADPKPAVPVVTPEPPAPELPNYYIDTDRAKELWDQGKRNGSVWFIDARPRQDFLASHVARAMHVTPDMLAGAPGKVVNNLPGMTIVVYCQGAQCTDSASVMKRLQNLKRDIGPIYIMKDGFPSWQALGFPVESGPDPYGP